MIFAGFLIEARKIIKIMENKYLIKMTLLSAQFGFLWKNRKITFGHWQKRQKLTVLRDNACDLICFEMNIQ